MKSKIHNLIEKLMDVIVPTIASEKSYDNILAAFGCINARIVMAAPKREGLSLKASANIARTQLNEYTSNALAEFIKIEKEEEAKLDCGINSFAEFARLDANQQLTAFNGGMGPELQEIAEEVAGQPHEKSWANSPIHKEIQDWEAEQAKLDAYKETE